MINNKFCSSSITLNFLKFYVYLLIIENVILILENKIICLFIYFYKEIFYYIAKMHNQFLQSIFVNKISIQDYKILIQQRFFNKFNFYLKIKYNNTEEIYVIQKIRIYKQRKF